MTKIGAGLENQPAIFSSWENNPDFYFEGHCFIGNDFIRGTDGAREFEEICGPINPCEDGCYLVYRQTGETATLGADARGLKRLFYYGEGSTWAVSNSLFGLAEYLVKKGVSLSPDNNQIASLLTGKKKLKQISSYQTVFNEIRLAASESRFSIDRNSLCQIDDSAKRSLTYTEAMAKAQDCWRSRLATLICDASMDKVFDLSGGLDSRTVLAMVIGLREQLPNSLFEKVHFHSSTSDHTTSDFKVATKIADSEGFTLNTCQASSAVAANGELKFERWRQLNLGVYSPLRFPRMIGSGAAISIGGGGGGMVRDAWRSIDSESYLDSLASSFQNVGLGIFSEYRSNVEEAIEKLTRRDNCTQSPMSLYYREF